MLLNFCLFKKKILEPSTKSPKWDKDCFILGSGVSQSLQTCWHRAKLRHGNESPWYWSPQTPGKAFDGQHAFFWALDWGPKAVLCTGPKPSPPRLEGNTPSLVSLLLYIIQTHTYEGLLWEFRLSYVGGMLNIHQCLCYTLTKSREVGMFRIWQLPWNRRGKIQETQYTELYIGLMALNGRKDKTQLNVRKWLYCMG